MIAWLTLLGCSEPCAKGAGCVVAEDLAAGLLSVRTAAPGDVWIVGASPDPDDGSGPVVLHRDGATFARLETSAWAGAELWWAWVDPDEAVFVGDQGLILQLDRASGALELVEGPSADTTFFGVWGASGADLWAVGQTEGGAGPPALWRRQQGTWSAFSGAAEADPGTVYFKVHGTSDDDVWIVGSAGSTRHWDGTTWTEVPTDFPTAPLLTVDASGDRPIAVGGAGNGLVLEHDGSGWIDVSPDFQPGFNGVCSNGTTTWAVGQAGARAQRVEGTWVTDDDEDVERSTSLDWHGCAVEDDGSLWTVGGRIATRPLNQGVVGYTGDDPPEALSL